MSVRVDGDITETSLRTIMDSVSVDMPIVVQFSPAGFSDSVLSTLVGTVLRTAKNATLSLVDPAASQLGTSYAACLVTDRSDGLFTTVVCSRNGLALGLVYSSTVSIIGALECGRGMY
jgi:hypothetical protein